MWHVLLIMKLICDTAFWVLILSVSKTGVCDYPFLSKSYLYCSWPLQLYSTCYYHCSGLFPYSSWFRITYLFCTCLPSPPKSTDGGITVNWLVVQTWSWDAQLTPQGGYRVTDCHIFTRDWLVMRWAPSGGQTHCRGHLITVPSGPAWKGHLWLPKA
jgi:hypothetical protein